jgi:hypothetical protein
MLKTLKDVGERDKIAATKKIRMKNGPVVVIINYYQLLSIIYQLIVIGINIIHGQIYLLQ